MATPTYDLIASSVLTSTTLSVTFSSIDQNYRDLILVVHGKTTGAFNLDVRLRFNSDTGTNYPTVYMRGSGSNATSNALTSANYFETGVAFGEPASEAGLGTIQILDYSATDKHKSILTRGKWADDFVYSVAGRWASTSAITNIEIFSGANNFDIGCTFYLYGIAG